MCISYILNMVLFKKIAEKPAPEADKSCPNAIDFCNIKVSRLAFLHPDVHVKS